ncbi:elongator complex protein 3 [Plasmodium brasilianum]|uniref:Histone S-adenosyl methyltransferase, putative n=2 Tax=Plasmodium (Plasmodium) TaxID=418103 RepID=A0A1A8WGT1_PLAMA|nr:elongator complex protein 3 [Plasmodium brasilianum]SBS91015.1 histone S-adenosyl methyltransferase, putative [Plasmodium malariae]
MKMSRKMKERMRELLEKIGASNNDETGNYVKKVGKNKKEIEEDVSEKAKTVTDSSNEINSNQRSYEDDILNETSDDEGDNDKHRNDNSTSNSNYSNGNNNSNNVLYENSMRRADVTNEKDIGFYINDVIKRNYPIEYEDNNIYPKVYCYEPTSFENFKKKLKNKNELRHYECYSSTMNEFFYKYNENYYDEILKNENFKKFAEELWSNRRYIENETQYNELCIQLRKKFKVSPSKHQISVALQYHYLQTLKDEKGDSIHDTGERKSNRGSNTSDVSNPSTGCDDTTIEENRVGIMNDNGIDNVNDKRVGNIRDNMVENVVDMKESTDCGSNEIVVNKKGKDVKFVLENVNKMIIAKEIKNYKDLDKESVHFLQINKRKGVRSNSGVLVVTIITHPHQFSCKYDCHYCPNEPNQPRSYLSTEPAILRANQNNFDVICQFFNRTTTLVNNGHVPDKIEILVLGGTWSCYDLNYQKEFIRDVYYSANIYPVLKDRRAKLSLEKEQEINEQSNCRIIGLTLETRPDQINKDELIRLRSYGCTRVQLGIQHTDDYILKKVNRQCTLKDCIRAIYLLKENGFKVDIHIMPDLPYSNVHKDISMFKEILCSTDLQADQWKIYPCEITPFTKIEKWYNNNEFKPYFETDKNLLISLILLVKKSIHPWIRLNRVIRDIPNPSIIAGNNITNMRQLIANEMNIRNIFCQCIRCKEVKNQQIQTKKDSIFLKIFKYSTLGGDEFFITFQGTKKQVNKEVLRYSKRKRKRGKTTEKGRKDAINCNSSIKSGTATHCGKQNGIASSSTLPCGEKEDAIGLSSILSTSQYMPDAESFMCNKEMDKVHKSEDVKINESNSGNASVLNNFTDDNRSSSDMVRKRKTVHQDNKLYSSFDDDKDYDNKHLLLGFLRLRLRYKNNYCDERPFKCLENAALIRELHIYGSLLKHDDFKDDLNFVQHKGLGKSLVLVAEIIAYYYKYNKMSIIAGIGTKEYYKKLGYTKEETYMTKILDREIIFKNYILNRSRIGKTLTIYDYNLNHCLYLMHKEICEPPKFKRSEIKELNRYINDNIIPLGSQFCHESFKNESTPYTIDVDTLLDIRERNMLITPIVDLLKKLADKYLLKDNGKYLRNGGGESSCESITGSGSNGTCDSICNKICKYLDKYLVKYVGKYFVKNRGIFNASTLLLFGTTLFLTTQIIKKKKNIPL